MRQYIFISILIISLLTGLIGYLFLSPTQITTKEVSLKTSDRLHLRARLYEPTHLDGATPAIVLCQGISSSKELLSIFASELATRGLRVLIPDWRGQGESQRVEKGMGIDNFHSDLEASVQFLKQHPQVNGNELALIGHSMGATIIVESALDIPGVQAIIAYGMDSVKKDIPNFLLGTGLYDEFYPVRNVQSAFQRLMEQEKSVPSQTPTDFKTKKAREFFIIPASHTLENLNPTMMNKSFQWLQRAFPNHPFPPSRSSANRVLFFGLFIWGILGLGGYLLVHLQARRKLTIWAAIISLAILPLLSPYLPLLWAANLALFIFVLTFLSNLVARSTQSKQSVTEHFQSLYERGTIIYIFSVIVYGVILCINAHDVVFAHAGLLDMIAYTFRFMLSLPWISLQGAKPFLFSEYSTRLMVDWPFYLLWLVECAYPGLLGLLKKQEVVSQ